ncbi:MAG: hypothetical protein RLZZ165_1918 [Bacteroidota bacterium]|jgi:hypothetical protein
MLKPKLDFLPRWIFSAPLVLLVTSGLAFAQPRVPPKEEEKPPVKSILKISPFHFIGGTFLLSYERMIREEKSSLMLSVGLHSRSSQEYDYVGSSPEFGVQEELQYRLYLVPPQNFSRNGREVWYFKGFYAGPYASHRLLQRTVSVWDYFTQQNTTQTESLNELAGGVILGVQIAMGNRFFMDLYTGGGIKRSFGQIRTGTNISVIEPGYNGVYPKIGFQIGIGL